MITEDFQEYMMQAKALIGQEKYQEAIHYLIKAEKENNMDCNVYLTKGIAYANLSKYEEAKKEFEKVLKIEKNNGTALFHIGNIEILMGNKAKGIELYNNAIANGFNDAQVYFSLGLMQEEDGSYELAIRNYSKAIAKDPLRADIRIRKIRLLIKNKLLSEAIQAVDELILSNPDVFEGYHLKFLTLISLERLEEAEQVINQAMELFPKDAAFALDKASLMITRKQYEEALNYLDLIRDQMDLDTDIEHTIAMEKARIYAYLHDMDHAITSLETARKIFEDAKLADLEATYLLMNCYLSMEKYEKVVEEASKLKKATGKSYYSLAAYYYEPFALKQLGQMEKAAALFQESVSFYRAESLKNPENLDSYAFRVMSLREMGKLEKALELADYLVTIKADLPEGHILRATVLEEMGRNEEAKSERAKSESLGGMLSGTRTKTE